MEGKSRKLLAWALPTLMKVPERLHTRAGYKEVRKTWKRCIDLEPKGETKNFYFNGHCNDTMDHLLENSGSHSWEKKAEELGE